VHFPLTADGWRLALHRHRPRSGGTGYPVILCGGYACNRYFLDYDERYSLARFLARTGFDAWVIEPRGRGLSHPDPETAPPQSWTFDDLVDFDAPAAIEHVTRMTGSRVAWIGHSMGGMLLYAYLGRNADREHPVAAGVTIASPVVFPTIHSTLLRRLGPFLLSLPFTEMIPQRWAVGLLWALLANSSNLFGDVAALRIGFNPDNVDRQMVGGAMRAAICNIPRAKLRQLARWSLEGVFCSVDGQIDYRAALEGVRTPILVTAGSADTVAPPAAVRRALDRLPAGRSDYMEFGRAHGQSADYGHVDLILGRVASVEVFPALASWIRSAVEA
jgi:pimeloyl-ACP methyl ester carboxylesterase